MESTPDASRAVSAPVAPQHRVFRWLHKIFGAKAAKHDVMLEYFISELDVRAEGMEARLTAAAENTLLASVRTELADIGSKHEPSAARQNEAAWNEAYRLERRLALVESGDQLWPELQRQLAEAKEEKVKDVTRLSAAADAAFLRAFNKESPPTLIVSEVPILRGLLLEILEQLHWAYQRKFYARPIRKSATRRIVTCGVVAFCLLLLPYVLLFRALQQGATEDLIRGWAWLPLYSALTAGLFGALFSRLLYLQQNLGALTVGGFKDARDYTSIILRGCVGMTGAVIVSFFLQSSVVSGSLFPDFTQIGLQDIYYPVVNAATDAAGQAPVRPSMLILHLIYPSKHLALLVVWSFLAGFSERLVPSILKDTETSLGKTSEP